MIDSFGKIPSGIVLGNFAWIGELSECINITAIEETWRGEYVLLERPMDPLEIFRPGSSLVTTFLSYYYLLKKNGNNLNPLLITRTSNMECVCRIIVLRKISMRSLASVNKLS